jgi:IgA-specific serine endopeptidase
LKPGQRTTEKDVPGETTLKEQDSVQGPNSFFAQIVKRVQGTAEQESPGEEAQALLVKAQAEKQAAREAEEKLEAEEQATQVAEEKIEAEEQTAQVAQEKIKAEKPATKEAQQREAQELVENAKVLGTEEAIEVYDEAISRFQEAKETALEEQVAEAQGRRASRQ